MKLLEDDDDDIIKNSQGCYAKMLLEAEEIEELNAWLNEEVFGEDDVFVKKKWNATLRTKLDQLMSKAEECDTVLDLKS